MWHMINISILLLFLFALHIQGRTVLKTQHINETYHLPTVRGKESYGDSCTDDEGCGERQKCKGTEDAMFCECADGLSGPDCETKEWCEEGGKFGNCEATGGTCEYDTTKRLVECTCSPDKKLHPTESKCRDTCYTSHDCENEGECKDGFCDCKLGLTGDKCETIFDCSPEGKYRGCNYNGATCTFDGTAAVCKCPPNQKYDGTEHKCKEMSCENNSDCGERQKCATRDDFSQTCVCADGLSGDKCEKNDWCKGNGKFKNCKGSNGTCEYVEDKRSVDCTCKDGKKLHPTQNRCVDYCLIDANCNANQICMYENGWKSCVCAAGLSGKFCEKKEWCEKGGRFESCREANGTCEYDTSSRSVECTCTAGKELHPTENRCREMCRNDFDCKNGGKCEDNKICSCKPGLFGDKCQHIFDCSSKGKYKGCESSGGNCFYNGNETVCECPDNTNYHDTEHICKVIETSTLDIIDSSSVKTKIFTTVPTCYCGSATKSCYLDSFGDKYCSCLSGYIPVNGYCAAICGEDKCVHGKCETVENNFKCRCYEGFTGKRCEDRIQTKSGKQDLWTILQVALMFAIFLLLSVMFCFLARIKTKH